MKLDKLNLTDKEIEVLVRVLKNNFAEEPSDFELGDRSESHVTSILDKLMNVSAHAENYFDELNQNRKSEPIRKWPFLKTLFLGSGWHSIICCNLLHKRLQHAFSVLGGMQQNGGQGTEFDEQSDKEDKQAIKDVLNELLWAFNLVPDDLKTTTDDIK